MTEAEFVCWSRYHALQAQAEQAAAQRAGL